MDQNRNGVRQLVNIDSNKIGTWDSVFNIGAEARSPPEHIWFQVKDPFIKFEERDADLQKLHSLLNPSRSADAGQRRVMLTSDERRFGKSELLSKYCHDYRAYYDNNVVWINKPIKDCVIQLAIELNIIVAQGAQQRNYNLILQDIAGFFKGKRALVVFDDVKFDDILQLFNKLRDCPLLSIAVTTMDRSTYDDSWGWFIVDHFDLDFLLECRQDSFTEFFVD